MARGRLSPEEVNILKENKYVEAIDEFRIVYTNEFKFLFMQEYENGKKPTQIFREAGFDPKVLGTKRIERAASRWSESWAAGSLGEFHDGVIGKRKKLEIQELMNDFQIEKFIEILQKHQERIELLEAEIESLRRQSK